MTDTTDHGIPASVLERAAEAIGEFIEDFYASELDDAIERALPILTTAIERELLQRMIADARKQAKGASICDLIANWIERTYLPTATEGADDHAS